MTNVEVRATTGCHPFSHLVTDRRLRLFGHIACSSSQEDHHRVVAAVIWGLPPDWKRPSGRPSHTWLRAVEAVLLHWCIWHVGTMQDSDDTIHRHVTNVEVRATTRCCPLSHLVTDRRQQNIGLASAWRKAAIRVLTASHQMPFLTKINFLPFAYTSHATELP